MQTQDHGFAFTIYLYVHTPPKTSCPRRASQTASLARAEPGMVATLQDKLDKEGCGHQIDLVLKDLPLEWKKNIRVSAGCRRFTLCVLKCVVL
jgi:hypothetical protein